MQARWLIVVSALGIAALTVTSCASLPGVTAPVAPPAAATAPAPTAPPPIPPESPPTALPQPTAQPAVAPAPTAASLGILPAIPTAPAGNQFPTPAARPAQATPGDAVAQPVESLKRPISSVPTIVLPVGTATAMVKPTAAPAKPTVPPTPTAKPETGPKVLYQDDFSDSKSGWTVSSSQTAKNAYQDGRYAMTLLTAPGKSGSSSYSLVSLDSQRFGDAAFTVRIQMDASHPDGAYGILFRLQDYDNYYKLTVDPFIGQFHFYKLVANKSTDLVPWTESKAIKRGTEPNLVALIGTGSSISVAINGTVVGTAQDKSFASGKVGFSINAWSQPFTAYFDQLAVYEAK